MLLVQWTSGMRKKFFALSINLLVVLNCCTFLAGVRYLRYFSFIYMRVKVVLEARVTLFKSIDFKATWSLSQNTFVYKFSVQGNLYLARYKQLKFRLQGKCCRKITTTNGSNCNCGLRQHSLRYANLTVCDLKFRLQNYHKSHTLCLVCLIHASLNGISQATFLLLDTIVFHQRRKTEQCKFCYVTLKY